MGKTAVVIIHGVGEQRPMGTVSSFTRFFAGDFVRSKPDNESQLFELRRLSTFVKDRTNVNEMKLVREAIARLPEYPHDTVFYEFYWGFHYRDTKPSLVIRWVLRTLWKLLSTGQCWRLGRRVVSIGAACVAVIIVFLTTVILIARGVSHLVRPSQDLWSGTWQVAVGMILPWFAMAIRPIFVGWIGDAARYFGKSADNPVERQEIRKAGIDLLKRLHKPDRNGNLVYDSIVLVGHSLGSVIAYDLITNYWVEVNRDIEIDENNTVLKEIEVLVGNKPAASAASWNVPKDTPTGQEYQSAQNRLVDALGDIVNQRGRKVKDVWRIRDLVTLGSPLTYARFLLADNGRELSDRQTQRELPTCPPTKDIHPDKKGRRSFVFTFPPITREDTVVPDQTAPFLLTRWTNLYFPQDPIGGPLRPIFGWGILDLEVNIPANPGNIEKKRHMRHWLKWVGDHFGGAHVRYWEQTDDKPPQPISGDCAEALRKIIKGR